MNPIHTIGSEKPVFDLSHTPINKLKWKASNRSRKTQKAQRCGVSTAEAKWIEGLRNLDENVFEEIIDRYHSNFVRLAKVYVPSEAVAEEVVQETWVSVLEGFHRFEGRSSLKTWLFQILINRAKTRGIREKRYLPFSRQKRGGHETHHEYSMEPTPTTSAGSTTHQGPTASTTWDEFSPERLFLSKESFSQVKSAINQLPSVQQKVILLRDVDGLSATEVSDLLRLTEGNQRVLLHRARSKVRRALAGYIGSGLE